MKQAFAAASFDLEAYLGRIGLKQVPAADIGGLIAVQRAHRLTIPFENIDVALGRTISLDPQSLFEKLVVRRRGGYCFEQNGLLLLALRAVGFEARPLLARVWLDATETPPHTHMLLLVTIDGEDWIADAGFGGSYTPPMRLAEGEIGDESGTRHRLRRDAAHGWTLERRGPHQETDGRGGVEGWVSQYSFTLAEVWPGDIAMSNHFTSTAPGTRFTSNVIASIVLPNGFASLVNRAYKRTSASGTEMSELNSARMARMRLSLVFGLDLTSEEVAALGFI